MRLGVVLGNEFYDEVAAERLQKRGQTLERDVVSLVQEESDITGNPCMLPYLNRLSDVLFLLARYEEKQQGVDLEHRKD